MKEIEGTVRKSMAEIEYLEESRRFDLPVLEYRDTYTICFQLKGKRYLFYDRVCHEMEAGEAAVLAPLEIFYSEIREGDTDERYVIHFRPELLDCILSPDEKDTLLKKLGSGVVRLPEEKMERLYYKFLQAEEYIRSPGFLSEKLLAMAVMQLGMIVAECTEDGERVEGKRILPQIERILDDIWENYKKNRTLEEMAETAGLSKFYFCRTFRKVTGATVVEYTNHVRLIHAHKLLLETELSVEEIAQQTGLTSSTNFARVFKKVYGTTPSNFRKERKKRQNCGDTN